MIELDDPKWEGLKGGYRVTYDPRPAVRALEAAENRQDLWDELWTELHHQGDIGEASYAAVIALVQIEKRQRRFGWNLLALAATIEIERHRSGNPPVPAWLETDYREAWTDLAEFALQDLRSGEDNERVRTALPVIALARGQHKLGAFLWWLDESDLDALVEERLSWSETYGETRRNDHC
jgi:hypothetical protein